MCYNEPERWLDFGDIWPWQLQLIYAPVEHTAAPLIQWWLIALYKCIYLLTNLLTLLNLKQIYCCKLRSRAFRILHSSVMVKCGYGEEQTELEFQMKKCWQNGGWWTNNENHSAERTLLDWAYFEAWEFTAGYCLPFNAIFDFWHSGTLTLSPERQCAQMSEI